MSDTNDPSMNAEHNNDDIDHRHRDRDSRRIISKSRDRRDHHDSHRIDDEEKQRSHSKDNHSSQSATDATTTATDTTDTTPHSTSMVTEDIDIKMTESNTTTTDTNDNNNNNDPTSTVTAADIKQQSKQDKLKARGRYRGDRRRSHHRSSISPNRSSRSRSNGGRRGRRSPRNSSGHGNNNNNSNNNNGGGSASSSSDVRRSDRRNRDDYRRGYRSRGYRSRRHRRSTSRSPSYRRRRHRRRRSYSRSRSRSTSTHHRRRRRSHSRSRRRSSSRSSRSPKETRQEREAKQKKEQTSALMKAAVSGVVGTPASAVSIPTSAVSPAGAVGGSAAALAGLAGLTDPATRALVQQLLTALTNTAAANNNNGGGIGGNINNNSSSNPAMMGGLGGLAALVGKTGGGTAAGFGGSAGAASMIPTTTDTNTILLNQLLSGNMATLGMSSMHPQLTRPARRVYVGNLPIDVNFNDQVLTEYFTQCSQNFGIRTPKPVKSVWIHSERTFGFVEFRSVRDTTLCLKLFEGVPLGGRNLRFGRPMDYKAPPPGLSYFMCESAELEGIDKDKEECLRFLEPGSVAEIYAKQIFKNEDVSGIIASMGLAGTASSATDNGDSVTTDITDSSSSNISITPASTFVNKNKQDSEISNDDVSKNVLAVSGVQAISSAVDIKVADVRSGPLSEVIVMNGMFNDEESIDLSKPEEMEEILSDVEETCSDFGNVVRVHIPKPEETGFGRCFVQFENRTAAQKCFTGMNGRTFGGEENVISCHWFDLDLFNSNDYGADFLTGSV